MNYKIIKNDFVNSKLITLTTTLFVAAAALLVSLAAILAVNLTGAIETLMTQAKTPHFMQMHSSEIDAEKIDSFAKQNSAVDEFQVVEFLNMDSAKIILGKNSLADSTQDNGFSTQSTKFDYLLDLNGNIINIRDGELYVPICYMRDNTTKVGDKAVICGNEFTVAGFLRDSQMNSMLSSSKRFLVSQNDYEVLKSLGNTEYLVEFRLKNLSSLSTFAEEYTAAGLPANGPTITYGYITGTDYDFIPGIKGEYVTNIIYDNVNNFDVNQNYLTVEIYKNPIAGVCCTRGGFDITNKTNHILMYTIDSRKQYVYDLETYKQVAAHEFGHILGLADLYPEANSNKVINGERNQEMDKGSIMYQMYHITSNDLEMVLEAFKTNQTQYFIDTDEHKKSSVIRLPQEFYD